MTKKKTVTIILLSVIAIITIGLMVAMLLTKDSRKLQKNLNLGYKCLQELNYDGAIAAFNDAIAIDPKNVEAYEGLAEAYEGLEEYEKAVEVLEKGLAEVQEKDREKLEKRLEKDRKEIEKKKKAAIDEQNKVDAPKEGMADETENEEDSEQAVTIDGGYRIITPYYWDMSGFPDYIQDSGLVRMSTYDFNGNIADQEVVICCGDEDYLAVDVPLLVDDETNLRVRFTYESMGTAEGIYEDEAIVYYGAKIVDLAELEYEAGEIVSVYDLIVDGQPVGQWVDLFY